MAAVQPDDPPERPHPTLGPTAPFDASRTRFVLVGTSHPGNVGAAARALAVMGFAELVLVAPRHVDLCSRPEAIALSSGATDVLERARVVATLAEALDGITFACATAMTPRDFGPPTRAPRPLFAELAASAHRVALVFGSERFGLCNDDVYRCQACVSIPTAPDYGSLNLAQAVQLLAYDWRQALGGFDVVPRTAPTRLADATAVEGTLEHWRRVLVAIDFLDPRVPRKLLPRLRRLLHRATPTVEEVHILRGIARAVEKKSGGAQGAGQAGAEPAADAAPPGAANSGAG